MRLLYYVDTLSAVGYSIVSTRVSVESIVLDRHLYEPSVIVHYRHVLCGCCTVSTLYQPSVIVLYRHVYHPADIILYLYVYHLADKGIVSTLVLSDICCTIVFPV
jgi:hypothetical protein